MEPANSIIAKFGGARPLARRLGVSPSTVLRWARQDGTGGIIPATYQMWLMAEARQSGIDLSPADFFPQAAE